MRLAGFIVLLFALSWPALARQDQSQTPPAQTQTAPPAAQPQAGSNQAEPPATQSQAPTGEAQTPAQGAPPTAQAPAQGAPPPSQAPAQASTPEGAQQAPATAAPPASGKKKKKASKKKSAKKKTSKVHKPHKQAEEKKEAAAADTGPRRIVIRRGGTSDTGGQLEPGVPETEATRQGKANEQMLQSTESRLKDISGRKLTAAQQDMARQIQFYVQQARAANREGDLGRARNLAVKAQMLCDALARQ